MQPLTAMQEKSLLLIALLSNYISPFNTRNRWQEGETGRESEWERVRRRRRQCHFHFLHNSLSLFSRLWLHFLRMSHLEQYPNYNTPTTRPSPHSFPTTACQHNHHVHTIRVCTFGSCPEKGFIGTFQSRHPSVWITACGGGWGWGWLQSVVMCLAVLETSTVSWVKVSNYKSRIHTYLAGMALQTKCCCPLLHVCSC